MTEHMVNQARLFAKNAHQGQIRKCTGEPYIVHPIRVERLVREVNGTIAMRVAALLHDTVEDTDITITNIQEAFGYSVMRLVYHMTNPSRPGDGNRAARKEIDKQFNATAPKEAKLIRLADICDNLNSVHLAGKDFARMYVKEKRNLLTVLTDVCPELYVLAQLRCTDALRNAGINVQEVNPATVRIVP